MKKAYEAPVVEEMLNTKEVLEAVSLNGISGGLDLPPVEGGDEIE